MKLSQKSYVVQRANLMAQEFLLDLGALSVNSLPSADFGLDLIAFFEGSDASVKIVGVNLKATEREIGHTFPFASDDLRALRNSNLPVMLLVVDAKRNELYFAWASGPHSTISVGQSSIASNVRMQVLDRSRRLQLRREIQTL